MYASMSLSLNYLWGLEPVTEHKAISATVSEVERGPVGRSRSWGRWLPDVEMHYLE
jgi:hypothetical protein